MAIQTPTPIDPVPTPPIQRGDRATFSSRVDAFILWLVNARTQFAAAVANVYNNALEAAGSATAAATSATTANTKAGNAATSATNAATSETNAATSATNAGNSATAAAGSATAAASSATGLTATSTSSNTVATGTKAFTVQAGKQFIAGIDIKAVDTANAANVMWGTVGSYSGTTLSMNVTSFSGNSGATVTSWAISVVGKIGAQGLVGPAGGSGLVAVKGNISGTVALNYSDGEAQTATATGSVALTATGFPAGRFSVIAFKLTNGGVGTFSTSGISWKKPDRTLTTTFSDLGVALQASGINELAFYSYGDGVVFGKVF